ncbi:MAG: peptidoglycan editing factor PgeF [Anaerolineae bacterium]
MNVPHDGLVAFRSALLADERIEHAVMGRLGGVSQSPYRSLNVGGTVGDDPSAVAENLRRIYAALGWDSERVVSGHQVHEDRVHRVSDDDAGQTIAATDALISDVPGILLMGRYADCVPILLFDPLRAAVGLAHAGWRGTVQGIAAKTVRAMVSNFGSQPADLIAAIGPSIGPCCFEVGASVRDEFRQAFSDAQGEVVDADGRYVNLWRANAIQLERCGVRAIDVAALCTSCHVDRFYSHRREKGGTGRFAVAIGLRSR